VHSVGITLEITLLNQIYMHQYTSDVSKSPTPFGTSWVPLIMVSIQ